MKRVRNTKGLTALFVTLLLTFTLIYIDRVSKISLIEYPDEEIIEDFQKIIDHPEKLFLYSAYFDHIDKSIKVIGGAKLDSYLVVYCQFYNENKKYILNSHRVGKIVDLEQTGDQFLPHRAVWVRCPMKSSDTQLHKYVSIMLDPVQVLDPPQNLFQIKYNSIIGLPSVNFTVCVQPTFSYDAPLRFLEWIEFYKLMGVEKFIFYNESIGPMTSCLMNQYNAAQQQVEVLKWSPVFKSNVEIHVHGQLIQNNECIYRSRGRSAYIISVDLDEMIMPSCESNVSNYNELMELIDARKSAKIGQISTYLFRNGFFYLSSAESNGISTPMLFHEDDDDLENQIYSKLVIATKFRRELNLYSVNDRSKYIARPDLVIRGGVHNIKEAQVGSSNYEVPSNLAYLHHYRSTRSTDRLQSSTMIDNAGERFGTQLSVNIARVLKKYGKACKIL